MWVAYWVWNMYETWRFLRQSVTHGVLFVLRSALSVLYCAQTRLQFARLEQRGIHAHGNNSVISVFVSQGGFFFLLKAKKMNIVLYA